MIDLEASLSLAELVVTVLTLGAGGYLGGQAAAIHRMRLEDRRTVYSEYLPEISTVPVEQEDRLAGQAQRYVEHWDQIDAAVALLGWSDKRSWLQVEQSGPAAAVAVLHSYEAQTSELEKEAHGKYSRQRRTAALEEIDKRGREAELSWRLVAAEWHQRSASGYVERLEEFRLYLLWSLKPTILNRLRRQWYQAKLVYRAAGGWIFRR
ncbi:MAG: hypothetical protein GY788_23665 [bacterium]|nr:hypothetical protein [bacterium]